MVKYYVNIIVIIKNIKIYRVKRLIFIIKINGEGCNSLVGNIFFWFEYSFLEVRR